MPRRPVWSACLLTVLVLLAIDPPIAGANETPAWSEEWEQGADAWDTAQGQMQIDCGLGASGCSLYMHPWETHDGLTPNTFRTATEPAVALDGGTYALSLLLRSVGTSSSNANLELRLELSDGSSLAYMVARSFCCTHGYPAFLSTSDGTSTGTFFTLPSADTWFRYELFLDADAGAVWGETSAMDGRPLAASTSLPVELAGRTIERLQIKSWMNGGLVAGVHLDTLRIGPVAYEGHPMPPTNLVATAGPARADLTWDAPEWPENDAIVQFRVYAQHHYNNEWLAGTTSGGDTMFTDTGLYPGETRTYRVAAVRDDGEVSWSSNFATATSWRPPRPVNSFQAEAEELHVDLAWEAPTWDGGGPILGYRIERWVEGQIPDKVITLDPETRSHRDEVVPGPEYEYRIFAVNAVGDSDPSSDRARPGRPSAPLDIVAVREPGLAQIVVTWNPPASDGIAPVLAYELAPVCYYYCSASNQPYVTTTTSYTDAQPPSGIAFYEVRAVNAIGAGEAGTSNAV